MKLPPLRRLPSAVANLLMNRVAPNFAYAENIVQLFLHGPQRRTTFTFTNVGSLYCPAAGNGCRYELTLYDETGHRVGRTKLDLPRFGTAEVRLHEHLRGPLPETGLLVARVRNRPRINRVANHLGAIRPHFFALYHTPEMGSLALIHPQTGLVDAPCPDLEWHSNLTFDPATAATIEAYQINPSPEPVRSELRLSAGDEVIGRSEAIVPARGSRCVRFGREQLASAKGRLHLPARGMTAPNAKPLLFQVAGDGSFSASHT